MKLEYIGPHASITAGRRELVVFEKGKATEVPDELGKKLLNQKKFRKAHAGSTHKKEE